MPDPEIIRLEPVVFMFDPNYALSRFCIACETRADPSVLANCL